MKRLFLFALFSFILVSCHRDELPKYMVAPDPTSLDQHLPERFGSSEKTSFL